MRGPRLFPAMALLGLAAALAGDSALAQQLPKQPPAQPNAANGQVLARKWCASCHVISSDQRVGTPDAPTFASIARGKNVTAEWIALFLLSPHPLMPDMSLTRQEAGDLAAHIRAQAAKR